MKRIDFLSGSLDVSCIGDKVILRFEFGLMFDSFVLQYILLVDVSSLNPFDFHQKFLPDSPTPVIGYKLFRNPMLAQNLSIIIKVLGVIMYLEFSSAIKSPFDVVEGAAVLSILLQLQIL